MENTANIQPPAPAAENENTDAPARWITPPRGRDACPYTGLRHASFYNAFANNPRIRQARMGTGKQRGTRLLWLPDIYAEINRRADEQAAN